MDETNRRLMIELSTTDLFTRRGLYIKQLYASMEAETNKEGEIIERIYIGQVFK